MLPYTPLTELVGYSGSVPYQQFRALFISRKKTEPKLGFCFTLRSELIRIIWFSWFNTIPCLVLPPGGRFNVLHYTTVPSSGKFITSWCLHTILSSIRANLCSNFFLAWLTSDLLHWPLTYSIDLWPAPLTPDLFHWPLTWLNYKILTNLVSQYKLYCSSFSLLNTKNGSQEFLFRWFFGATFSPLYTIYSRVEWEQ